MLTNAPTKIRPAMKAATTPRPRLPADQIAALSTLNRAQARAVAALVGKESSRISLRDSLVIGYRRLLPAGYSATRASIYIAGDIGAADPSHPQADWLALIKRLGRGGRAPIAKVIERILIKAENDGT